MQKIDLSSTAIEKAIDLIKDFTNSLIGPAIDETGLLLKDRVSYWRFKNQLNILSKAKAIVEKNGIQTKAISLKLLVPLLEHASLEEESELQNRWAILISNLVDASQNIENHVFPYILSQLSIEEYNSLQATINAKRDRLIKAQKELKSYVETKDLIKSDYEYQINNLSKQLSELRRELDFEEATIEQRLNYRSIYNHHSIIERQLFKHNNLEKELLDSIKEVQQELIDRSLETHQLSNLTRLGLIRLKVLPIAFIDSHSIRNEREEEYLTLEDVEIQVDVENERYYLTELGELFIRTCNEKQSSTN
ncbi:hypothetical protein GGR28_003771 [Lewinella aquimaris]|uniref:DUF4393 domain-containing protein n=1 Tax=Neolewinella aquimaris TaxID=1835722 RepID=A0A840E635_9BACT|nr:Abi-alpha family protein [Neolewinella aquimaris]MBB4081124.1 hypothetical protein [Neolewinella aquimaris]